MLWNHHMNLHDKYYCLFSNPSAGSFYAIWSQKYNTWGIAIATDEVVAWRSKAASLPKALRNWVWRWFCRVSWFLFESDERTDTHFLLGQIFGVYIFVFLLLFLSLVLKKWTVGLILFILNAPQDMERNQSACKKGRYSFSKHSKPVMTLAYLFASCVWIDILRAQICYCFLKLEVASGWLSYFLGAKSVGIKIANFKVHYTWSVSVLNIY